MSYRLNTKELESIIDNAVFKHVGPKSGFETNAIKLVNEYLSNNQLNMTREQLDAVVSLVLNLLALQSKYTVASCVEVINEILDQQS